MTIKTVTRNTDESVDVVETLGTNADGSPAVRRWGIAADHVDAHRATLIDAAADAPTKAQLDADKAARKAAADAAKAKA